MRGAVVAACLVFASCGGAPYPTANVPVEEAAPVIAAAAVAQPRGEPVARAAEFGTLSTDDMAAYSARAAVATKLRVFVTAEGSYFGGTGEVWVLEAASGGELSVIAKIPQGRWPHNLSVSPDGKWVAAANRTGNQVSIIDPIAMKEVQRIPVGKQPHGITWHPDSRSIFIAHERESYIGRIDVGTWKMTPIMVGIPQHVTLMRSTHPNELWFTVTLFGQAAWQDHHLRAYDLATGKISKVAVNDVHDAYFSPDESEIWSSSSGFLEKPSDRVVIYDPDRKTVKKEIRLPGRYPFHAMKHFRDGVHFLPDRSIMLLSSHFSAEKGTNGASLLWVDWKERKVVAETPLGRHPFHTAYDPIGERVLTTSNIDGMVNVIDVATKKVVQKIPVPKPHGIVTVSVPRN